MAPRSGSPCRSTISHSRKSHSDKKVILAIDDDPQVISLYERYLNPRVIMCAAHRSFEGQGTDPGTQTVRGDARYHDARQGWVVGPLGSQIRSRHPGLSGVICSIIEQEDKGFSLGAADYLVKPILEEDLVHALDRLNKDGRSEVLDHR
jgi:PleD family two-component response regulator